jgi:hypothetical protein
MKPSFRFVTIICPVLMAVGPLAAQRVQTPPAPVPQVAVPADPDSQADQPQGGTQTRPLTPLEERDRQIRQFDPRAPRERERLAGDPDPSTTPAKTSDDTRNKEKAKPLPGSVAASNQGQHDPRLEAQGPKVAGDNGDSLDADDDRYMGPAVLTRSYTLQSSQLPENVRLQYTLGASAIYDSGFSTLAPNQQGVGRFGSIYSWGISGRHSWKKDLVNFSYHGAWNNDPAQSLGGYNHAFQARYSRILRRRLTFNLVTAGSILSQGYALQNPITNPTNSLADVNVAVSPSVQLYGTTTRQATVGPSLQWQKSARLSFTLGGTWFGVSYDTPGFSGQTGSQAPVVVTSGVGLIGSTGFQAQADVNYRLTKRITTGAYYNSTFYDYEHDIAFTSSNGVGLIFSMSLDRYTQLRLRGGINFYQNQAYTVVAIDPILAAVLGTSHGIIDSYHRNNNNEISAELARDLHRSRTVTFAYTKGLAPGNGQIFASIQQSATAGFSMRLLRQYLFSSGVGWTNLDAIGTGPLQGKYETEYFFMGLNRPVTRRAQAVFRADYRKFNITTANGTPNQLRIELGVSWSSAEGTLHLW